MDSNDRTLSHIQACDLKGTVSVHHDLPSIFYVLHCKLSCALEKKNPELPVYELVKSKIEPEFKKGKLQIVTSSTGNRLRQEVIK